MYEITSRTAAPYSTVCYIVCEWPDGTFTRASGVVVGVNDVLTAGHVVYSAERGGLAVGLTIYPAADTEPILVQPYGAFDDVGLISRRVTDWDSDGDGLLTQSEAQYDLAIIGLRSAIGNVTGWATPLAENADFQATMVGYPAAGSGMMAEDVYADASAWYGVYEIASRLGAGASGGPLFHTEGGQTYVMGVLSSGDSVSSNYAALFGPGNWAWLQSAMAGNDGLIGTGGGTGGSGDDYAGSTATNGTLAVGGSATGRVEVYNDEDWFRISLSTGTYTFEVLGRDSGGGTLEDPFVSLYDAAGNLLNWDDDGGTGIDASLTATLSGGTYYVSAGAYPDPSSAPGTYLVRATRAGTGDGAGDYTGGTGADVLTGTAADEGFRGNGGDDALNGMGGFDTAYYAGDRGEYTLSRVAGAIRVSDTLMLDGTDTLSNMERIVFADMSVNLGIGANALTIGAAQLQLLEELYVAFFNRVPDADGLSYWIDQLRGGMSVNAIADAFYAAALQYPAETGYSGGMGNADFVNVIYRNVLGRADGADADGLAYWSGALADGSETRGSLVTAILGSAHWFKGNATWGWVADLLDNKAYVADLFAVDMGLGYNSPSESITHGIAIADAVTPTSTAAAVALIGVDDGFSTLA